MASYFSVFMSLLVLLHLTGSSALAKKTKELTPASIDYHQPLILLAVAEPPDFLKNESSQTSDEDAAKGADVAITPFIGPDQALTTQPTPERPAISINETVSLDRPEVTAGVNVDLGTFNFNLGYTLPAKQVDSFVRPLGVNLEPGTDVKRFSLGVKIPF